MIGEKLNSIFRAKAFNVTFSIIVAVALWAYVAYVDNPDVPTTVTGIPVQLVGEENLADNNLMVTQTDNKTLNITFYGKRSDVTRLTSSNVVATVDLSEIVDAGNAGVYMLSYELTYPDDINSRNISRTESSVDYITLNVEKMATTKVPVKAVLNGAVAEGYQAQPVVYEPEEITVYGTAASVLKVASAYINVDIDNISKTLVSDVPITLMDKDGNAIVDDTLRMSDDTITVTIPVEMVKEIELVVNLEHGASTNDFNVVCTVFPSSITLSGDPEVLEDLEVITLDTIDLTEFVASTVDTYDVSIPNGTTCISGTPTAMVTVEIKGLATDRFAVTNIQTKNVTEGYKVGIITKSLDVTLRATEATLAEITPDNIRLVADFEEYGSMTGVFSVEAKVYVDGYTDVDVIGACTVTVQLAQIGEHPDRY